MSEDIETPDVPDPSDAPSESDKAADSVDAADDASAQKADTKASGDADDGASLVNTQSTGEIMDRVERKKLKEQKKQAEAEAKKKLEDELGTALKKGRLADKKKVKTKKRIKIGGTLVAAFLCYLLYGFLFGVHQAGATYGICKVYLETQVRFPLYLNYIGLADDGDNVRIWYTRTDAFGGQRLEIIRCYYKYDEATGSSIVDKITIDRREEPDDKVARFNVVLPVVLENLPDLSRPSSNSEKGLGNIQVDRTAVRQPVL